MAVSRKREVKGIETIKKHGMDVDALSEVATLCRSVDALLRITFFSLVRTFWREDRVYEPWDPLLFDIYRQL